MARHWSEVLGCRCGMTFRTMAEEAKHRHNFPALCRQPRKKERVRCGCGWTGMRDAVPGAAFMERPCPRCGDIPDRAFNKEK